MGYAARWFSWATRPVGSVSYMGMARGTQCGALRKEPTCQGKEKGGDATRR